jgi:hypothetical protein
LNSQDAVAHYRYSNQRRSIVDFNTQKLAFGNDTAKAKNMLGNVILGGIDNNQV